MAALGITFDGDWARGAPERNRTSTGPSAGAPASRCHVRSRLGRVACSVAASIMPSIAHAGASDASRIAPMERVRAADDDRSDETLLQSHIDGDPRALEHLIRRHSGELHGFLTRFLGSSAAADDVFQETFLQVHLSAEAFDSERQFKPWLYTIAANKARDFHRKRKRRAMVSLSAPVAESGGSETPLSSMIEADGPSPDAPVEAHDEAAAVKAVVDELPEHHREILALSYFQRMSYQQMSEVLQIPLGTVKSRLHAAVGLFSERWRRARRQGKDDRE
jgi:RNA polymerase sigma-70 factor (ECF subfamily)